MRPQSEIRVDLAAALVDGGGTTKQLAQRTGWAIRLTRTALDNMVRAGQACKPRSVRVPGVKRPVPWYERPPTGFSAPAGHVSLAHALAGWSQWPRYARQEGARM